MSDITIVRTSSGWYAKCAECGAWIANWSKNDAHTVADGRTVAEFFNHVCEKP